MDEFNAAALQLFDKEDGARGVLECEDRSGQYLQAVEVASKAVAVRRRAKRHAVGVFYLQPEDDDAADG
ncbi:MAG: hypothetical protein M3374_00430 [Pseudomonadota bacterium]|nr:hypothetical protein [Pseudomonadota bacterium]